MAFKKESLKMKLQTGVYPDVQTAVSTLWQTGGWKNMYQGFFGHVLRDMPFRTLQILAYDWARRYYLDNVRKRAELSKGDAIAVGAATGAVIGALTTPLDVVRTRVMSQRVGAGKVYTSWMKCLSSTVQAEGAGALFRGVVPRTVYMGASVALFSVAFEISRNVLKKNELLWHTAKARNSKKLNHIVMAPSTTNSDSISSYKPGSLCFAGTPAPLSSAARRPLSSL